MKFSSIYMILGLCFLGFIFSSNEFGRAAGQNWGNTGAPGDQLLGNGQPRTCITCHNTGSIQVTLDISLKDTDGNLITDAYTPGQTYDVEVLIDHAGGQMPQGYGFQMVALDDATETDINTWAMPSSNVKFSNASNTGRTYAEQNGRSDTGSFTMQWTAPAEGTGSVTFYSCGNGVNGTGSSGGDGAAISTLSLSEGEVSSNENVIARAFDINISPNPAKQFLNLEVKTSKSAEFKIDILSSQGERIESRYVDFHTGDNNINLNVADLPVGMYFIQVQNLRGSAIHKWMKF